MAAPLGVVNVEGVPELRRLFKAAVGKIPDELKDANRAIGDEIIRRVRPKLPKEAGDYAGSLRASRTSWQAVVRAGGVRAKAMHAPLIHWGTAYRPTVGARPQIAAEAQAAEAWVAATYLDNIDRVLRSISAD